MAQLTYKEIHLLIEQGLNSLGLFTEQSLLHEQVDLAINHVVEKHITKLYDTPAKDRTSIEKSIIRYLTRTNLLPVNKSSRYYERDLPEDFGELSTSHSIIGLCDCKDICCHSNKAQSCNECQTHEDKDIVKDQWYIAITAVKYNNKWYKPKEKFKGEYDGANVYGTYEKLTTEYRANILSEIDALEANTTNALIRNSFRPLLAWDENKFYIYYETCNKNETLLELFINYTISYNDSLKISWCDEKTLNFPSEIQRYYIDLAIAYIALINKQEQQNIVNLKQETI